MPLLVSSSLQELDSLRRGEPREPNRDGAFVLKYAFSKDLCAAALATPSWVHTVRPDLD